MDEFAERFGIWEYECGYPSRGHTLEGRWNSVWLSLTEDGTIAALSVYGVV